MNPMELEILANRRWLKVRAIEKAQKAVEGILADYPIAKRSAVSSLEREKEIAIEELKDFQEEYRIAILTERSEHEKVIADMVEDVVDEKQVCEDVIDTTRRPEELRAYLNFLAE